eukprot:NODE_1054_length_2630_cov_14.226928.p1 GENE.NODE_1054_length_2630_cov_14.226928~~NODE_1054_length_2630_cov_14.226928.p1  ORF type:complete len:730 (-),score=196.07 NODE_1054_length_2630_cov_14.226928:440-2380(-)
MWEFFKLMFAQHGVRQKTLTIVLFDQVHNLYYGLTVFLNVYMVDTLFSMSDPTSEGRLLIPNNRHATAVLCGMLYFVPFAAIHAWAVKRRQLGLAGGCRTWLMTQMFRRYLNYNEASRLQTSRSALLFTTLNETAAVVNDGYMNAIKLVDVFGKLVVVVIFICHSNPKFLLPFLFFPLVLVLFVWWRKDAYIRSMYAITAKEQNIVGVMQSTSEHYRLIADYQRRPQMNDVFAKSVQPMMGGHKALDITMIHNLMFPNWISLALTGGYFCVFSHQVIDGSLSVGTFVALVKIFGELGVEFKDGYQDLMHLAGAVGPLQRITVLLNRGTDLDMNKRAHKEGTMMTEEERNAIFCETGHEEQDVGANEKMQNLLRSCKGLTSMVDDPESDLTDLVAIRIHNLKFELESVKAGRKLSIVSEGDIRLAQGSKIAIFGPHGCGKSSVLQMISRTYFPAAGSTLFIPTHLQILHVSHIPAVLDTPAASGTKMGLLGNLTFGCDTYDIDRVKKIMERLGLVQEIDLIDKELDNNVVEDFWTLLSSTSCQLVHFARALITDPEVMVLESPFRSFDYVTQPVIQQVLEEFVTNRGFEVDPKTRKARRPRTVFFTTTELEHVTGFADNVLLISDGKMREVHDLSELHSFEFLVPRR